MSITTTALKQPKQSTLAAPLPPPASSWSPPVSASVSLAEPSIFVLEKKFDDQAPFINSPLTDSPQSDTTSIRATSILLVLEKIDLVNRSDSGYRRQYQSLPQTATNPVTACIASPFFLFKMKILEAQSAVLSNFEVFQHAVDQRKRYKKSKRRGPPNLENVMREVSLSEAR